MVFFFRCAQVRCICIAIYSLNEQTSTEGIGIGGGYFLKIWCTISHAKNTEQNKVHGPLWVLEEEVGNFFKVLVQNKKRKK